MKNYIETAVFKFLRIFGRLQTKPSDVMEREWHNLFILDSCRADKFSKVMQSFPELDHCHFEVRNSTSTSSPEFVKHNFSGKYFGDCILITANPYPSTLSPQSFYYRFDAWKHLFNENYNNVHPKDLIDVFNLYRERFPDKRIIVWFMQPHIPFISDPDLFTDYSFKDRTSEISNSGQASSSYKNIWEKVLDNEIDGERVWKGYEKDIELALNEIITNHSEKSGQTAITADHGEICRKLFGIKLFGHPSHIRIKDLVDVPWLILEGDTPKTHYEELAISNSADKDELNETLKKFGYWD